MTSFLLIDYFPPLRGVSVTGERVEIYKTFLNESRFEIWADEQITLADLGRLADFGRYLP